MIFLIFSKQFSTKLILVYQITWIKVLFVFWSFTNFVLHDICITFSVTLQERVFQKKVHVLEKWPCIFVVNTTYETFELTLSPHVTVFFPQQGSPNLDGFFNIKNFCGFGKFLYVWYIGSQTVRRNSWIYGMTSSSSIFGFFCDVENSYSIQMFWKNEISSCYF